MAQQTMYPGINNSPQTATTTEITASATTIPVSDVSKLPAAPNIATLGVGDTAELITYNGKDSGTGTLTGCVRGLSGTTASLWPADTVVYRAYTTLDHDAYINNINDLNTRLSNMMTSMFHVGFIIYTTSPDFDTAAKVGAFYGGTWEAYSQGRVMVGVDPAQTEFDTIEKTGGAKTHTLTIAQLPTLTGDFSLHNGSVATNIHSVSGVFSGRNLANKYNSGGTGTDGATSIGSVNFNNGGQNAAHNNLQPYITVYMWRRIA